LALQYQLVTQHTNFILIHTRAVGEKAQDLPQLEQIGHMQAAGAGGYGTVIQETLSSMSLSHPMLRIGSDNIAFRLSESSKKSLNTPAVWRTNRTQASSSLEGMGSTGMEDIEIPAFLRKQPDGKDEPIAAKIAPRLTSSVVQSISKLVAKGADALTHRPSQKPNKPTTPAPARQADKSVPIPSAQTYSQSAQEFATVLKTLNSPNNPLVEILQLFNKHALGNRTFRSALSVTLGASQIGFMTAFVLHHAKQLGSPAMVWAVILFWLADAKGREMDRHAMRLIEAEIAKLDGDSVEDLRRQLESRSTISQTI
jgi:hypothetical protein